MPTRRSKARRRSPQGPHYGRLVLLFVILGLGVFFSVMIGKQFAGYFNQRKPPKHVAVVESPSPLPSAAASASPLLSPSPTASGASPAPRVAIIIDDCGYNLPRDLRFLRLPVAVTLSILPMTPHGKEVAAAAQAAGKAVILHLPMEPESSTAHPGPGAITTAMTDDQVKSQVAVDIASLPPMPGANNHMGSKATSDARIMRDVLSVLKQDDMFFIDSMTAMTSIGSSTARDLGVPTAERDVFLDNQATVPYVEGQIKELEAVARRNGTAIGIGHPNPETAEALEKMVPEMQAAGFSFVTAQSLVK
jgi:polysaccharide deacetylase 2 family uncharacterized protein YibQ